MFPTESSYRLAATPAAAAPGLFRRRQPLLSAVVAVATLSVLFAAGQIAAASGVGAQGVLDVTATSECVGEDGRLVTEITNTGDLPLTWSIEYPGTQLSPQTGTTGVGVTTTLKRSGRTDGNYTVMVTAAEETETFVVVVDCVFDGIAAGPGDDGVTVLATPECVEDNGRLVVEIANPTNEPVAWTVQYPFTQLENRSGETPAGETSTIRRSGRPNGDYVVTVNAGTESYAFNLQLLCGNIAASPPPNITRSVSVECANGDGRLVADVNNGTAERIGWVMIYPFTSLDTLAGALEPGQSVIRKRSGRPDGDYTVIVRTGDISEAFNVTVACDEA